MADPTSLEHAQEMYDKYIAAESAILHSQEYWIGDRRLTRADLESVAAQRKYWGDLVEKLTSNPSGTKPRVMRVVPRC